MLQVTNLTKHKPPKIPWRKIKEKILGRKHRISMIFANNGLMRKLNARYRKEHKAASVLSFSISKNEGEIFINLGQKKHSSLLLLIHGLLHLKGFRHGCRMKSIEDKLIKQYGPRHSNRP